MLESPNYVASVEKGELVPMVTLNKFDNVEDEWTWWEKLHIIFKMFLGDEMGVTTSLPPTGHSSLLCAIHGFFVCL